MLLNEFIDFCCAIDAMIKSFGAEKSFRDGYEVKRRLVFEAINHEMTSVLYDDNPYNHSIPLWPELSKEAQDLKEWIANNYRIPSQ